MSYVETRLRVRYAETDRMGIVYYAHYLTWMEVGRVEWCRAQGFQYRDMEREQGAFLVVAEAHCRYLAPALFDDEVVIVTHLARARTRQIRFEYEIRKASTGQVLATGATVHIVCGPDGRPRRLPEQYRRYFMEPAARKTGTSATSRPNVPSGASDGGWCAE